MPVDSRWRAALLLAFVFCVGGVAGVALDRRMFLPEREARGGGADRDQDLGRIPVPLEALGLSQAETTQLHPIARRWRQRASITLDSIRHEVNDLESGMFAEMLCVLDPPHRDRYVDQLRRSGYPTAVIDRRTALVRTNSCPAAR